MSTTKHTPGPWQVDAIFPDKERGHDFEPRVSIEAFCPEFESVIRLADIPDVAGEDTEEMANAHLIAAAPDMLEALEYAAEIIKVARNYFPKSVSNHDRFNLENTNAAINKAIAKAKGGGA